MVLTLPHKPQGDQWNFFNKNSRFNVGVIGRQWGKSTTGQLRQGRHLLTTKNGNAYWVSPIVPQARVQYERFLNQYSSFIQKYNKSHMEAKLINGSWAHYKGSDNPASLKGDTLTWATLDECATMHPAVWPESIQPMLAVNQGHADLIGTPKGKNWYFLVAESAKADKSGVWSFHHAPSSKSPFFSEAEFLRLKSELSEATFRQEILAEFLDRGSEVFKDFRRCMKGELEKPQPGRIYRVGADIAKHVDWTVITTWDVERRHMVSFERFNQVDWALIENRIVSTAEMYNNAIIKLDATGVGDPVYDRLYRRGARVHPVRISAPVKANLIESLAMAIEKEEISFPHIPELEHELAIFSISKTPSGNIKYEAPPGYHDDIVMSMALAVEGVMSSRVVEAQPF